MSTYNQNQLTSIFRTTQENKRHNNIVRIRSTHEINMVKYKERKIYSGVLIISAKNLQV